MSQPSEESGVSIAKSVLPEIEHGRQTAPQTILLTSEACDYIATMLLARKSEISQSIIGQAVQGNSPGPVTLTPSEWDEVIFTLRERLSAHETSATPQAPT